MSTLKITVGDLVFAGRLENENAPRTCAAFEELLPYRQKIIHARWSGEACWIPLGDFDLKVGSENHTTYPSRGDVLFYPNGISETEILFPYGSTHFASKMGSLAGNHFLTIVEGMENLPEVGRRCLWDGAQDVIFELSDPYEKPGEANGGKLRTKKRHNEDENEDQDEGKETDSTEILRLKQEFIKAKLAQRRRKRSRS